jgi:hypothetical protein
VREAAGAGTPRQAQDHGLCLVVARMRNREAIALDGANRFSIELLPGVASRDFERHMMFSRLRRDVRIADDHRYPKTLGKPTAERLVVIRLRTANVMIQVGDPSEDQIAGRRKIP